MLKLALLGYFAVAYGVLLKIDDFTVPDAGVADTTASSPYNIAQEECTISPASLGASSALFTHRKMCANLILAPDLGVNDEYSSKINAGTLQGSVSGTNIQGFAGAVYTRSSGLGSVDLTSSGANNAFKFTMFSSVVQFTTTTHNIYWYHDEACTNLQGSVVGYQDPPATGKDVVISFHSRTSGDMPTDVLCLKFDAKMDLDSQTFSLTGELVTDFSNDATTTSGAMGESDPHFLGFRGQRFDLVHEPRYVGQYLDLYCDSSLHVYGHLGSDAVGRLFFVGGVILFHGEVIAFDLHDYSALLERFLAAELPVVVRTPGATVTVLINELHGSRYVDFMFTASAEKGFGLLGQTLASDSWVHGAEHFLVDAPVLECS